MKIDLHNREFLQELCKKADEEAKVVVNSHWKRVYERMSSVAGELDAYIARTIRK